MNVIGLVKKLPMPLVLIGGLVHGLTAIGQTAIVAAIPFFNIVQIAVGVSAVYLIAKELKLIK